MPVPVLVPVPVPVPIPLPVPVLVEGVVPVPMEGVVVPDDGVVVLVPAPLVRKKETIVFVSHGETNTNIN